MEDLSALSARTRLAALLRPFAKVKDARQAYKVMYPLHEVLFLVVCGTIASGDDYDDIVDWGEAHLTVLRGFAEFHFGIPCVDWPRCIMIRACSGTALSLGSRHQPAVGGEGLAAAAHGHWAIENKLHWVLDVTFREDLSRLRTGHGAKNMAVVRHFALNLVRQVADKRSIKATRKRAAWHHTCWKFSGRCGVNLDSLPWTIG
jgi:hypothetical protein